MRTGEKISKVPTAGMDRETWLSLRKRSIGGSDAAGILGLSSYSSPYSVWADKTGRLPDVPDNEAMRQGRDLEAYVAERFCEATGKKVKRLQAFIYNSKYPFAHANIDRQVVGERAGLECKTTSTLDVRQFNGVDFPEKYYAQCVHYLAVTGWDRWYLAVLVLGKGFYTYTLERNQAEIDALMTQEGLFWVLVKNDTPPTVDGTEATTEAIKTIYRESRDGDTVDLFGRDGVLAEYTDLAHQQSLIKARMAELANIIKQDMGEAERGAVGTFKVLWKSQERKDFQIKAFQADHPEIDLSAYYTKTKSRPFKITKTDKNEEE